MKKSYYYEKKGSFEKINFQAINLLQKADLNKNR